MKRDFIHPEFGENAYKDIPRCFILGNGPSLNKFNLDNLNKELTFGVNHILRSGFTPDFLSISDEFVIRVESDFELIKNSPAKKVICHHVAKKFVDNKRLEWTDFVKTPSFYKGPVFPFNYPRLWEGDFDQVRCVGSVVGDLSLPLAIYLGIKNIFLLGMDDYWFPDPAKETHFFKRTLSEYEKKNLVIGRARDAWFARIDMLARMRGVVIQNLSPGTALCAFEKKDAHQLFPELINSKVHQAIGCKIKFEDKILNIISANNGDSSACSIQDESQKSCLRHHDGKFIFSKKSDGDKTFNDDSTFYIEKSFVDKNKVCFRSSNMKNKYLAKDVFNPGYKLCAFRDPFLAIESSFELIESKMSNSLYEITDPRQYILNSYSNLGVDYETAKAKTDEYFEVNNIKKEPMFSEHYRIFTAISMIKNNIGNILEIGTYNGSFTKYLSWIFPNAYITTVDLPSDSSIFRQTYGRNNDANLQRFIDTRTKNINNDKIKFIELNSFKLPNLSLPKFDLIWIDGSHEFPDVALDIHTALQLSHENTYILSDDVYIANEIKHNTTAYLTFEKLREYGILDTKYFIKRMYDPKKTKVNNVKFVSFSTILSNKK